MGTAYGSWWVRRRPRASGRRMKPAIEKRFRGDKSEDESLDGSWLCKDSHNRSRPLKISSVPTIPKGTVAN